MSTPPPSLASRHSDLTQRLILEGCIELLERAPVTELSMRAVARHVGISERTVFRYFPARDELLDAVAQEASRRLDLPPHPTTVEELLAYPALAFARFEATAALTKAALHSELYDRIRTADAHDRGAAIRELVDRLAPARAERERKLAAANIRYFQIATTWHYFRFYFELSLEETIECSRSAILLTLKSLGVRVNGRQ